MINGLVSIRIYFYRFRLNVNYCQISAVQKNMAKKVTNYVIEFATRTSLLKTQSYARICGSQNGILHTHSIIFKIELRLDQISELFASQRQYTSNRATN